MLLHISLTDPFWKMYTIVIQLGAILALLLLFLPRILAYWRTFPQGERGEKDLADASAFAHVDRLCLHRDPGEAADQEDWSEP